ncbi:hypothetical protein TNCT_234891 [Trichonephila clavata]|uniref:Uncharacterized protein n=1 Tax=Trichonephila clavata TaxID=2740835 RepID=A0A8X6J5M0_TRICU|nr:hypothetical protein TNCT_234891 [Trichonephila clavata]
MKLHLTVQMYLKECKCLGTLSFSFFFFLYLFRGIQNWAENFTVASADIRSVVPNGKGGVAEHGMHSSRGAGHMKNSRFICMSRAAKYSAVMTGPRKSFHGTFLFLPCGDSSVSRFGFW